MKSEFVKSMAGMANIARHKDDLELMERCPFCNSHTIDSHYVDGRKAEPSWCLDCGATEKHPYRDIDMSKFAEKDGWIKES